MTQRTTGLVTLAGVLTSIGLLVAACGGSPAHNAVASLGHAKTTTTVQSPSPAGTGGGGGGGGLSSSSGGSEGVALATGNYTNGLKFSRCMRSHGVPNFPDPSSTGGIQFNVNPRSSPDFQAALKACQKFLPKGGQPTAAQQAKKTAQALRFSECMRSHGLPNFPDPGSNGISISAKGSNSDLDPNSPQFQAASKACQSIIGKGSLSQKSEATAAR